MVKLLLKENRKPELLFEDLESRDFLEVNGPGQRARVHSPSRAIMIAVKQIKGVSNAQKFSVQEAGPGPRNNACQCWDLFPDPGAG